MSFAFGSTYFKTYQKSRRLVYSVHACLMRKHTITALGIRKQKTISCFCWSFEMNVKNNKNAL